MPSGLLWSSERSPAPAPSPARPLRQAAPHPVSPVRTRFRLSGGRSPLARFLAVVFLWGPHLGSPLRALGTSSVQRIPRSLCPNTGCGCSERGPLTPPGFPPPRFFRARTSGPHSTLSAPPRSSDRCPLARFLAVVFLWDPHLGPPLRSLGTPSVQRAPSGSSAVTR
ncbi:hypothetical protein NDU88_006470 [Pleurodeles waltl]|uniref:Uncharacterized protein n=1 Tax=Pleurodeles waltl TaxID=8319 RepID=A0AAV7RPM1_PLEWA|nr:hypothetical protein NDU88_006470 [Pleurodeles waltl]